MIELKQIKALVKLMVDNNLTEVDLQDDQGERVKLKRGGDGGVQYVTPTAPVAPVPLAAGQPAPPATPAAESSADEGLVPIKSIMVGTFYSASSPDVPPFVQVGDNIGPESVICVIEAMKVFNEVKAEISGSIEKICVENGEAVEHDQVLFLVRPS
jgi:acetyl-CoA carboxylase biotin carboxyl carrier protein